MASAGGCSCMSASWELVGASASRSLVEDPSTVDVTHRIQLHCFHHNQIGYGATLDGVAPYTPAGAHSASRTLSIARCVLPQSTME
jgi:hypothetical protein